MIKQLGNKFFMTKDNVSKAYDALCRHYVTAENALYSLEDFPNFDSAISNFNFAVTYDKDGNACSILFDGCEYYEEDWQMLDVIAPFVQEGAYIDMLDEDGVWRQYFDGQNAICYSADYWFDCDEDPVHKVISAFASALHISYDAAAGMIGQSVNSTTKDIKKRILLLETPALVGLWNDFCDKQKPLVTRQIHEIKSFSQTYKDTDPSRLVSILSRARGCEGWGDAEYFREHDNALFFYPAAEARLLILKYADDLAEYCKKNNIEF